MECAQVAEAVQKYHEGEASLKDDPEVFAHLKGCAACRESLQKVLYDVDLAAYSAFFEEIDPPEDFADQVIDAIPGGEEKAEGRRPERGGARKKAGSSGKLAVVRGERKPLGRALRASASAGLKPAHHTTTVRRREEPSGVFLTDQIFGSQEKKRGLIITYCEECGERIDPADFDTGAAIQHQNASYCRKCKSKVVPEELEPEGASREKAEAKAKRPARAEASPRAAASRGAPAPRAAQPVNYMKVGGIFMGVALLLVVGVVVVLSTGGDDGAPPPRERAAGAKAKREDAAGGGQGGAEAKKAEAGNKGGSELDKLMAVEQQVAEEERKKKEEEDRRKAVPGQKIQAWREVARKLEEEKKFDEALQAWNQNLEAAQGGEMKDEKDLPVTFTPEHVGEIEGEISNVKRRWSTFVAAEVARIITKSASLCEEARQAAEAGKDDEMKAKFEEARKILKEYPPKWDTLFPDEVNRLVQYKNDVDYRERQTVQLVVQGRMKKAQRTIENGSWVELIRDEDDFRANWGGSQGLKWAWNKEEKSMSFEGDRGTNMVPVFGGVSKAWLDYELQFEFTSASGFLLFMRYQQGKEIRVQAPAQAQFSKLTLKIEGVAIFIYEGDQLRAQSVIDVQTGPPVFLLLGPGATVFKNMKVKVNKTA